MRKGFESKVFCSYLHSVIEKNIRVRANRIFIICHRSTNRYLIMTLLRYWFKSSAINFVCTYKKLIRKVHFVFFRLVRYLFGKFHMDVELMYPKLVFICRIVCGKHALFHLRMSSYILPRCKENVWSLANHTNVVRSKQK